MNRAKIFVAVPIVYWMTFSVYAQHVKNVGYSFGADESSNKKTYINYDLVAEYENIVCDVKVKLTAGEKSFYVKNVTGDVGPLVYPGTKKAIVWDHTEELVHFSGEINLTIEVAPSVRVPHKVKRGKQLSVALAPIYTENKSYAVKLFQGRKEVARLNDILLIENSFPISIPRKTRVKKKYQLSITDGENTFFSNTFKVKPKLSRKWIIVPLLAVPAYFYINQIIEENQDLPGPPIPE